MHHERTVFVGDPDPNDPAVFERLMAAMASLEKKGLRFELISDEESKPLDLHQLTWQLAEDTQTEVAFVRDCHNLMGYVTAKSSKSSIVRDIIDAFEAQLPTTSQQELVESANSRLTLEPNVLLKLALIARKNDPEVMDILRKASDHRLPAVRYCAVRAMAITQWHAFSEDLESTLKLENDADVRDMAEHALHICAKDSNLARRTR